MLLDLLPAVRAHRRLCEDLLAGRVPAEPEPHLEALLSFAGKRNAYYAPLLAGAARLSDLPVLTKAVIREQGERLRSAGARGPLRRNSSGGSTGAPATFLQDAEYARWNRATEAYYFRSFLGVDPLEARKVVLWGSERDTRRELDLKGRAAGWASNTVLLNTFKAGDADWDRYVEVINRVEPVFVKGYAGSLHRLVRRARERGARLHAPRFVYSSAERLRPDMRRDIEEGFGAKVHDFYGSREVGPIAGECRSGRRHLFAFNNLVEVQGGRILVTNLHNRAMPLIRYDIGDTGALGAGACPCGSRLPWLAELHGRVTDHFRRRDGTLVHGEYFTHLFYFREWVREFQVVQRDYDAVEISVVAAPDRGGMSEVEEGIRLVLGSRCKVDWRFVDAIPPTPQGKRLFTRCLLPER